MSRRLIIGVGFGIALPFIPRPAPAQELFADDFERGLSRWETYGVGGVFLRQSGDSTHEHVMVLRPNGDVHALIRGSDRWDGVQLEGEALFPTDANSYLGFIYNFVSQGDRTDFGNVYLKGNDNYLQVNPHRDYNVGRTLYPEMRAVLTADDSVSIGEWLQFKVEVVGAECHVYVGNMDIPKIVFSDFESATGALGLQPRSVGGEVWVDNIRVSAIQRFGYSGPPVPAFEYAPAQLLTDWELLGPYERTADDAARGGGRGVWKPFPSDRRGAVVTGRVLDFHGPGSVAYFRTRMNSTRDQTAILHFSTIDDLSIWVNGRFHWFMDRGTRAWPDFWRNAEHTGQRIPVDLKEGDNEIVIRVRGGIYATGGFFVRLEGSDLDNR